MCVVLSVSSPSREPLRLGFCWVEEWWRHVLHERCVPAALHAAWPSRGAHITFTPCVLYFVSNFNWRAIFLGFSFYWGRYRPARGKCLLPSPVSVWPFDGKQTSILCPWKLLEGNCKVLKGNQKLNKVFNLANLSCRFSRCGIRSYMWENSRMHMSFSPVLWTSSMNI